MESENNPPRRPIAIACYTNAQGDLLTRNLFYKTEIRRVIEADVDDIGNRPCVIIYGKELEIDYLW